MSQTGGHCPGLTGKAISCAVIQTSQSPAQLKALITSEEGTLPAHNRSSASFTVFISFTLLSFVELKQLVFNVNFLFKSL